MPNIRWDRNDGSGLNVGFLPDHATGQLHVVHNQSSAVISAILSNNAFRRNTEDNSARRRSGKLFQLAEVPNGIVMEWLVKYGVDINNVDHWPQVMQLIHSRDYASVKVAEGNYLRRPVQSHFCGSRDRANHPLASNRARFDRATGGIIKAGVF